HGDRPELFPGRRDVALRLCGCQPVRVPRLAGGRSLGAGHRAGDTRAELPLHVTGDHRSRALPYVLGFGITDETFVVASLQERLTVRFFFGLAGTVYL